jgi:chemotaxis protein methyltransferase CheR
VWSAAASFGDEAYSIAMLLSDMQQQGRIGADWSILATDISDRVLRSAMQAIYPADRLRHVTPQRLQAPLPARRGREPKAWCRSVRRCANAGALRPAQPVPADRTPGPLRRDLPAQRADLLRRRRPSTAVVDRVLDACGPAACSSSARPRAACPAATPLQALAPGPFRKPLA